MLLLKNLNSFLSSVCHFLNVIDKSFIIIWPVSNEVFKWVFLYVLFSGMVSNTVKINKLTHGKISSALNINVNVIVKHVHYFSLTQKDD